MAKSCNVLRYLCFCGEYLEHSENGAGEGPEIHPVVITEELKGDDRVDGDDNGQDTEGIPNCSTEV